MKKISFIICNLIGILIEYLFIYFIFRYLFNISLMISQIMLLIIFIVMNALTIFANIEMHKPTEETEHRPNEELLMKIIDDVNWKYQKKFKLIYITVPQPNPAWCIGNCVYVNNNYSISKDYLAGVIAHELGHAISGISKFTYLPSIKPSTLIGKVIYLTVVAFATNKNHHLNNLGWFFFALYVIISLNNIIFVYPFLRNDEFAANSNAIKLGYGEELRCYYGLLDFDTANKLMVKADFTHPSVQKMLERMNQELAIEPLYQDLYTVKGKLIVSYQRTKTIKLPSFITEIGANAFKNSNLKKISSTCVTKVHSQAFSGNSQLEEINLPNVVIFSPQVIKKLPNLRTIIINSEEIQLAIIKNCINTNKNLVNKLLAKLCKVGCLEAIEFVSELKNKNVE